MEPKKNPKYDIHRSRAIIFNVSLAISLLLVITAFEWSVASLNSKVQRPTRNTELIEMASIPVVREKKREVTAPALPKTSNQKPVLESINITEVSDEKPVEEPPPGIIDQTQNPMIEIPMTAVELPLEKTDTVYLIVEKMPEPKGGWETFFKTLTKNMKYPRHAARANVSGKVFVGFTVDETGSLRDFSIEGGIGFGCDEEAARVIALTKWNPGKQRGRPVKVRFVQPVTFSLGTQP